MTGDRIVWTARGACDACAKPIARRVEGAGLWDAKCHACGTTSRILSERVRLAPGGPAVEDIALPSVRGSDPRTTPLGLPRTRAERKRASSARRGLPRVEPKRRNLWAAPTGAFALLLLVAAGWLAFGPAPISADASESTPPRESTMALYVEPAPAAEPSGILDITLLSGDAAIRSTSVDTRAGEPGQRLVFQTVVPAESLRLMVVDENGFVHVDAPVDAERCAGALLQVALRITEDGGVELAETRCE